jgi:hypothetical protein
MPHESPHESAFALPLQDNQLTFSVSVSQQIMTAAIVNRRYCPISTARLKIAL